MPLIRLNPSPAATLFNTAKGGTLMEVLVSGLMAAFITAIRLSSHGQTYVDAASLAQQTLERFRNRIACDDPWFNAATCTPGALPTNAPHSLAGTTLGDPIYAGTRDYTVTPVDCDGDLVPGDCFQVVTTLTWTQPQ